MSTAPSSRLVEALNDLAALIEMRRPRTARIAAALNGLATILEANYTYDTVNEKRWVLGSGGKSGNCETCNDNADKGWIEDDDIFEDSDGGDIDGPPAHPNCDCELEYRERRVRVYD